MNSIGYLEALEQLYLDGTQVSDEGLQHLHSNRLPYLRVLNVHNTQVTAPGLTKLRMDFPDLAIGADQDLLKKLTPKSKTSTGEKVSSQRAALHQRAPAKQPSSLKGSINKLTLPLVSALAIGLLIALFGKHKRPQKENGFRRGAVVLASVLLILLGSLNQNALLSIFASLILIVEFRKNSDEASTTN